MTADPGTASQARPRVVIAEDSVLLAGLTKPLDSAGFEVCATTGDAEELLAAVDRERPEADIAAAIRASGLAPRTVPVTKPGPGYVMNVAPCWEETSRCRIHDVE